jgi:putative Holliday junction resolvase
MNLLAIDFGKKRIGLAWTDTAVGVVLPYGIIENSKFEILNSKLAELISSERIQKIIIGLPLGLDGKENGNTKVVREFGDQLSTLTKTPVEYVDERFSSRAADALGADGASRDEKAAMGILQTYVERK